jgi:hypothetical protein
MALSNMQVFNQYIMPAIYEQVAQKVALFNAASGNSIVLTAEGFDGDFLQESFYKTLSAARRRVDRYGANTTVSATPLEQLLHNSVKVAGGFGPVVFEPSQLTWLQKPTAEGIAVASGQFADLFVQDMLNAAIASLSAAIGNQGAATTVDVSTGSGAKKVDYVAVNASHAKFGDHSQDIVAQVMDGKTYHDFIGYNLQNATSLFEAGNVRVVDILGKRTVVTDAPALQVAAVVSPSTPAKSRVLSLVTNAAVVHNNNDIISNIETSNGKERIETTFQTDYSFGLGLKGYTWDSANGGKSPTDADLATGTNWDKVATSIKHTAGVMAVGLY